MVDFLGNEISVGDRIVYPGRHGSSLWMNRAIVTEVNEKAKSIKAQRPPNGKWDTSTRNVVITETWRVVVVPNTPF